MVGSFTGYFSPEESTSYEMFDNAINTCAYASQLCRFIKEPLLSLTRSRLSLVGLFFIKLALSYVAYVSGSHICKTPNLL